MKAAAENVFLSKFCVGYCRRVYFGFTEKLKWNRHDIIAKIYSVFKVEFVGW